MHSTYQRRPSDLPCAGQAIRLILSVRKFFCHNPYCKRKIFAERLPAFSVERPKRPNKQERYEQVQELRRLGLSQQEIAERLAIGKRTVQRWQKRPSDDEINQPRRKRRSIFDPYAAYVLSRWQQGERSVSLLCARNSGAGLSRLPPDDVSLCESSAP